MSTPFQFSLTSHRWWTTVSKLAVDNASELCSDPFCLSCSLCIQHWSPRGPTLQDDPVKSAAFLTHLRDRAISMVCFCREGNVIFCCHGSEDPPVSHLPQHTHFNSSSTGRSRPPSPPEVNEEFSMCVPSPPQDLDHRHGLWQHCGIQHWFQSVAPRASEQVLSKKKKKSLRLTGGSAGWKTRVVVSCPSINMFRWARGNLRWDGFCFVFFPLLDFTPSTSKTRQVCEARAGTGDRWQKPNVAV